MARNVNDSVSSSRYCQACGAANPVLAAVCAACQQPFSQGTAGGGASTNPLTGLLLPAVVLYQRYRVLEVLDTDEVSTIYKAEDIQLGSRDVLLKEIGKNNTDTQEALAMIEKGRREMLTLASLVHPNLPRIYDYFVENSRWYFVMDFLDGETLAAYMSKRHYKPLPVEEVVDAGIQLSTVLDYLHIHQPPLGFNELTLETLWRTPDGKLYLLEVGTPAPAAAMPQRTSIYSLGKLLQQLRRGKKPARSPLSRLALPRPRLRFRNSQATPLKLLIGQMLHRDVNKRPYTMGMVKQELEHLAIQLIPTRDWRLARRTVLKLGGLASLAMVSSALTWQAESITHSYVPRPGYSPRLGGTIYTYDANSPVLSVAWSPNGRRIVMGARGVWDPQNEVHTSDANKNNVQSWDANSGEHTIYYRDPNLENGVESVVWTPDGRYIVAGTDDGVVCVWEAATGKRQGVYRGHAPGAMVVSVASSPDSTYIASSSADATVQVWEVATGHQHITYNNHSNTVTSVAWSPDGKYIASASYDRTVQIWEVTTGKTVFIYYKHANKVFAVAWSPDGQRIASGGSDTTVHIWPVSLFNGTGQGKKPSTIIYKGHKRAIQDISWSPDSRTIASAADNAQLWNGLTGAHIFTYTGHASNANLEVQAAAWSPNGRYIASGGYEGSVQVWNGR